jgi:TetR/AcrR family transcriptional repressor of nem operon
MKVSRAQAEANRERVIDASSRLFRERGFAGVGLNELMQAAGLTRGGFYGQFDSKQDLVRLALSRALQENLAQWQGVVAKTKKEPLRKFVQSYLSDVHARQVSEGCALAALAPDAEREGEGVRTVFGDGARDLSQLIDGLLPGPDEASRHDQAWACLAALVGAVVLSRAVADERDAKTIRRATGDMLLSHFS